MEVVSIDTFSLHNKNYFCIVDYHSKFPVIKKMEGLSADNLILACKVIFSEYGIPKKIMSDAGFNFICEKCKEFCTKMNMEPATPSSYCQQNNGQMEACIKLLKCTFKKGADTNADSHIALL